MIMSTQQNRLHISHLHSSCSFVILVTFNSVANIESVQEGDNVRK